MNRLAGLRSLQEALDHRVCGGAIPLARAHRHGDRIAERFFTKRATIEASAVSIDTARTVKPRSLVPPIEPLHQGISCLHGGHQVAQKFRNTTWPRRSRKAIWPAVRPGTVNSGAAVGRLGRIRSSSAKGSAAETDAGATTPAATRITAAASRARARTIRYAIFTSAIIPPFMCMG